MKNDEFLTVKAVANRLNISDRTVIKLIAKKELPAFMVSNKYRILSSDLEIYLKKAKVGSLEEK